VQGTPPNPFLRGNFTTTMMNLATKLSVGGGCTFSGLRAVQKSCVDSLLTQLRDPGFAVVRVDEPSSRHGLQVAISEAQKLDTFRFPEPKNHQILYDDPKRMVFRTLFDLALVSLRAVMYEANQIRPHAVPIHLQLAMQQLQQQHQRGNFQLFTNPHEPFSKEDDPFAQSFFNLFHYGHGLLNSHVDRSLITVIYSRSPALSLAKTNDSVSISRRSRLWVQDCRGTWHDADAAACTSQKDPMHAIVMVGEDLCSTMLGNVLDLFPAPHAVKVDAVHGEYIADSHHRPDPDQHTGISNSRLSAAMILRHDPPHNASVKKVDRWNVQPVVIKLREHFFHK
jgi:hypothetical protein